MLTDNEILRAIKYERININPFDIKKLGPVSYDITTKIEDMTRIDRRVYKLVSLEEFKLSKTITGIITMRSRSTKHGIFASYSALVDPGYKGHLIFSVFCSKFEFINLHYLKDLFQIIFFRLGKVNVAYNERESSTAMNRKGFNV